MLEILEGVAELSVAGALAVVKGPCSVVVERLCIIVAGEEVWTLVIMVGVVAPSDVMVGVGTTSVGKLSVDALGDSMVSVGVIGELLPLSVLSAIVLGVGLCMTTDEILRLLGDEKFTVVDVMPTGVPVSDGVDIVISPVLMLLSKLELVLCSERILLISPPLVVLGPSNEVAVVELISVDTLISSEDVLGVLIVARVEAGFGSPAGPVVRLSNVSDEIGPVSEAFIDELIGRMLLL